MDDAIITSAELGAYCIIQASVIIASFLWVVYPLKNHGTACSMEHSQHIGTPSHRVLIHLKDLTCNMCIKPQSIHQKQTVDAS